MPNEPRIVPGMKEAIEARRKARRLSLNAFAAESGLTRQGLAPVRNGHERAYQDRLLEGVAIALRWPTDWYQRLVSGEDARTFPDTDHSPRPRSTEDRLSAVEREVAELRADLQGLLDALDLPSP